MISDLLHPQQIQLGAEAADWQQAARLAGEVLVRCGAVEPRYVDAMIETVKTEGAYIVLTKGFALLHARPECGIGRECVGVITLKTPVEFGAGDKDPVDVAVAFACPEQDGHVLLIQQIAMLLIQDGFLNALRACTTPEELIAVVKHFER
ncbi:PTS sugar transporter subunit IIA [Hydrogenoanaerobacterium sp.]|uniref:PTS sugar transporter subunit IIA n=1 Tax=Hydrogenoanaerobacterium sp. TaxID=2953763 RepID=UPI0028A157B5|nr:PTS sugar transporter subunit IIA [Hydrogenoanaerobacterium sp.]